MKQRSNIHCHSVYSDGANTLEEMVLAAIGKGFVSLGFSEHAWTPYDGDCCIPKEDVPRYMAEAAALKEKYAGKIELYIGFELDSFEHTPKEALDFTIASSHYMYDGRAGAYYTIDYKTENFEKARDLIAGGDIRRMLAMYFDQLVGFARAYNPDVIGHLDLITKLNGGGRYWDEGSGWYRALMEKTAQRIAATGCIVEVNTGGITRGYKSGPYPSRELLGMLCALETPVLLSSDAHTAKTLDFWFDEAEALLRDVGYYSVKQLRGGKFVDVEL